MDGLKTSLVGCTGFVGGNLAAAHSFDNLYHSTNIETAFGANNGLVVYSGMPAEKFTASANPAADFAAAQNAMENIRRMAPQALVLISTVDVYPLPARVYEDTLPQAKNSPTYGKNRYALESWVREEYPEALILRLPGLFGKGLKKNFLYDMLTLTPSVLAGEKYEELAAKEPLVRQSYAEADNGFYRLKPLAPAEKQRLHDWFEQNDFNALRFTDSRSTYQFYNLAWLWRDIQRCRKLGLRLVNLATPPVEAGGLYATLTGREFVNHTEKGPVHYDMRTRYGREFGADDDYIADRNGVVAGIARFMAAGLAAEDSHRC